MILDVIICLSVFIFTTYAPAGKCCKLILLVLSAAASISPDIAYIWMLSMSVSVSETIWSTSLLTYIFISSPESVCTVDVTIGGQTEIAVHMLN